MFITLSEVSLPVYLTLSKVISKTEHLYNRDEVTWNARPSNLPPYIYYSIYCSIALPSLSISLSLSLTIYISISLYLYTSLSLSLSIYIHVSLPLYLYLYLFLFLSTLSLSLSLDLSPYICHSLIPPNGYTHPICRAQWRVYHAAP